MNEELLRASGYVYHSGKRTPESFRNAFGFDCTKYPQYFKVHGDGYVWTNRRFYLDTEAHFARQRQIVDMLTERLGV